MKVFLGGVPWDITETNLVQAFRPFGNIRIEWPGKDSSSIPKGYLYVIFEHEKQVRNLLSACTQDFGNGGGSWYFKVGFYEGCKNMPTAPSARRIIEISFHIINKRKIFALRSFRF